MCSAWKQREAGQGAAVAHWDRSRRLSGEEAAAVTGQIVKRF